MTNVYIREGRRDDLPGVLKLVKELALYERAPHEVINTEERMAREGFGEHPAFGFFVAEKQNEIIGISVYYYRYSTWKGKRLYLEDIIVTEEERGKGIGKLLFERTLKKSLEENCSGMNWQALDWNEPALNFYRKYKAKFDGEWINIALEHDAIKNVLDNKV